MEKLDFLQCTNLQVSMSIKKKKTVKMKFFYTNRFGKCILIKSIKIFKFYDTKFYIIRCINFASKCAVGNIGDSHSIEKQSRDARNICNVVSIYVGKFEYCV